MRIIPLHRKDNADYSCIAYWILGENNTTETKNTLVDTGSSHPENLPFFLNAMTREAKGIGKHAVEQVILTHSHFDHTGGLAGIEQEFNPDVFSWLPLGRRHRPLYDGYHIAMGDQVGKVLHTPGHSEDSICIFLSETGILFSGDTLYRISDNKGVYPSAYLRSLERLANAPVRAVYPGHGVPILKDAGRFIENCLEKVRHSRILDEI